MLCELLVALTSLVSAAGAGLASLAGCCDCPPRLSGTGCAFVFCVPNEGALTGASTKLDEAGFLIPCDTGTFTLLLGVDDTALTFPSSRPVAIIVMLTSLADYIIINCTEDDVSIFTCNLSKVCNCIVCFDDSHIS